MALHHTHTNSTVPLEEARQANRALSVLRAPQRCSLALHTRVAALLANCGLHLKAHLGPAHSLDAHHMSTDSGEGAHHLRHCLCQQALPTARWPSEQQMTPSQCSRRGTVRGGSQGGGNLRVCSWE
jgi:hypothetical protein